MTTCGSEKERGLAEVVLAPVFSRSGIFRLYFKLFMELDLRTLDRYKTQGAIRLNISSE